MKEVQREERMDASNGRRRGPSQCERGQGGMELQRYKPKPAVSLFFLAGKARHQG